LSSSAPRDAAEPGGAAGLSGSPGKFLERPDPRLRVLAYLVHVYTATGLICSAAIAASIAQQAHRSAFLWMIIGVLIDATDGTFARRVGVKKVLPHIDGRKLDDIVDYVNYTFLPLWLVASAGWVPEPGWLWVSVPLIASAFAFINTGAKEEANGFFLGFPSYWNVFAFYTAYVLHDVGSGAVLAVAMVLSAFSVLPVRFVYPIQAPRWRGAFVWGAVAWLVVLLAILAYPPGPEVPPWLLWASGVYPLFYVAASAYLDFDQRRWSRRGGT
jgi:phosphatidylcholine synthase